MASRESAFAGDDSDAARNTDGRFKDSSRDRPLGPVFASASSKPLFVSGASSMLSFGAVNGEKGARNWFYQDEGMDEYFDECFGQPEKKRRLSLDQIHFLERTFEADNKLEPERKMQLAKELGLQPRQIAIWFQNRRARWKSRQLENDYEALRSSYDSLKANYENLITENENLKIEVHGLRCHGHADRTGQENLTLHNATMTPQETLSEDGESRVSAAAMKNEEQSSAKSDVTNVETMPNGICKAFEFNESGLSQNGENDSTEQLLLPDYSFPRMEDAHCHIPSSSFYYGFLAEDPGFGFWPS